MQTVGWVLTGLATGRKTQSQAALLFLMRGRAVKTNPQPASAFLSGHTAVLLCACGSCLRSYMNFVFRVCIDG